MCTGPCVSAYHLRCLELPAAASSSPPARENWLCPYCSSHTQRCFHCKKLGASSSTEKSGSSSGVESPPAPATAAGAPSSGLLPVRKCRALSCGKFYHHDCITALPLARIAGTHFICPVRIEIAMLTRGKEPLISPLSAGSHGFSCTLVLRASTLERRRSQSGVCDAPWHTTPAVYLKIVFKTWQESALSAPSIRRPHLQAALRRSQRRVVQRHHQFHLLG